MSRSEDPALFTVCVLLAAVWLTCPVCAQLNTFNQPQLPLNTFVGQPSAFQQQINTGGGFVSQPNTLGLTSAAIGVGSSCDQSAQMTISNCAQELNQLGVFTPNARGGGLGGVPQSTFDQVRRENKDYFQQICSAFRRFTACLSVGRIKETCYSLEPFKHQYAVADSALEYICGQGYFSMLSNWDCYLASSSRNDVSVCEARVNSDIQRADLLVSQGFQQQPPQVFATTNTGFGSPASNSALGFNRFQATQSPACIAMQNYAECIREPMSMTCGQDAWRNMVQAIQRPMQVYLPYCTLGSASIRAHTCLILIAFIVFILYK